jgi:hypothetical protein
MLTMTTKSFTAAMLAVALGISSGARAESASELVEKGIYAEETKGDIDGAIRLYEQALAESKTSQASGAQAQFRLALCYLKKNDVAEASAAFDKLIKDYPDQKELIAKARQYLPGDLMLLPVPWTDGEVLQYVFKLQSGFKIGTAVYQAKLAELNGKKVWRVGARMAVGSQSISRVEVDAGTFRPIHSRWKHDLLGDVEVNYKDGHVELISKGKEELKKIDVDGVVYDNEQVVHLMRRLPLAVGYKATIPIISSLGTSATIPIGLHVTDKEVVQVPAGKFECYRIELNIKQTFWIATGASRWVTKFEAGGASGELIEIRQRKTGERLQLRDPVQNFSLLAPDGWFFHQPERRDGSSSSHVVVLDSETTASAGVTVKPLERLSPEEKVSVRAWAESEVAQEAKQLKDFQMQPDGLRERSITGRAGITFVADYVESEKKKTVSGAFVFGETRAAMFTMDAEQEQWAALKPKFDAILDGFNW